LSADGANVSPSTEGGSAQLRTTTAYVDVKIQDDAQTGRTGYKVSYSLKATTTRLSDYSASMRVSYRTTDGQNYSESEVVGVTIDESRHNVYLPSNATNIRFELASVSSAYVFLDAVEISQEPEIAGFSPSEGVPTTQVTITGTRLTETNQVYFGGTTAEFVVVDSTKLTATVPFGIKTDFIRVVTPFGQATSATEFVVPAPEFAAETEFAPASAGVGEEITLYGRYFTGVNQVLFNGVAADLAKIVLVNDNELTVTVPLAATSGPVTVKSPAGEDVSSNPFTVEGPQIIAQAADAEENPGSEFYPGTGPAGTVVSIYGKYLLGVTEVLFNGVPATAFTVENDNKITVTVPLGASTGTIIVKSPAGQDASTTPFDMPAPQFVAYDQVDSQFKPTSAGPGMQIMLYGLNLASASSVVFLGDENDIQDDREGTIVTPVTSDAQLAVIVPTDATTGKIQVIAPGDKVATSEQIFTFVPAPTIASVANTEGDRTVGNGITYGLVGEEITITGTNFETATAVLLGNATIAPYHETENADGFIVNGDGTAITFAIPGNATTGSVKVNTLGGQAVWAGPFDVILAPSNLSIAPAKGPIGQEITITGENLKYVSEVVFLGDEGTANDDLPIAITTPNGSDSELIVTVPEGAVTGKLRLVNPAGQTETAVFTVVRTPVILAFEPGIGIAGTEVKVTGYNFKNEGDVTVAFAGVEGIVAAASFTVINDTELTAVVPEGAVTGPITVTNTNGPGSSETNFTVIQKPTITSLDPIKGTEGSTVVITGTEFLGEGITVTFLGTAEGDAKVASTIKVDSETQITATVPVGAVTGKLVVTNAAGTSEPSAATYTVVTRPEIISFNPTEGKVGDAVTITGWLLEDVTGIAFNGTQAEFKYNSTNGTINTTVPTDATTGPLSLYVDGTMMNETTDVFTVIPAPTIVAFTPEQGVAETQVTITGTNFKGLSKVTFLGAEAAGDEADADLSGLTPEELSTEFTIAVPYSALTGKIQITATGGTAISEAVFTVPVPANITFTPTTSYAGQEVTISGNFFKNITKVTFNGVEADVADIAVVTNEGVESFKVKAPFDAGAGPIAITTPAGTGTSTDNYTVIEPVITSVSVSEGYAGRTAVTIQGTNFASYWNETSQSVQKAKPIVRVGTVAVDFTYDENTSDQTINFILPENARSGSITVESLSGISVGRPFSVLAPVVKTINSNPAYAGQLITVTGDNFLDIIGVSYNGEAVSIVEGSKNEKEVDGSFQFYAPKAKVTPDNGTTNLIVTTNSGSGSSAFTVYKPIISSVVETKTSLNRVYAGIGKTVTITGTRFDEYFDGNAVSKEGPTVTFTGSGSSSVTGTIVSATYSSVETGSDELVVEVPATAETGRVQVASNSGTGQSDSDITIIGSPTITAFSPTSGIVGSTFTISGSNFDEATKVTFLGREDVTGDEAEATDYTINASGTEITVTVPADAVAGKIAVTTPYNGSTTAASANAFRVVKAPVISGFTAESGPSGTVIRITGENLWDVYTNDPNGALKAFFKGHGSGTTIPAPIEEQREIAATVVGYDEEGGTYVDVRVPADAITGVIRVENIVASATTSSTFEVTSPVIVRFEHQDGNIIDTSKPARLLETVLIRGYQLKNLGTVKVDTLNANFFERENDPTTVEMVVPGGAKTSAAVSITAAEGNDTSAPLLLEIAVPTIEAIPTSLSFNATAGQPSETKTYEVRADNLAVGEEEVTIDVPGTNNFEISLNGTDWRKSLILTPRAGDAAGTISNTTIYVRNNPGEEVTTNQSGTATNSAFGAAPANVALDVVITPLPVELIAFNAVKQKNAVQLTWATASEQDNDFFEVEMAEEKGVEFKAIGRVHSRVNTTSIRQDYQFSHKGNFTGTRYYRLKQVDLDGAFEYSKVVAVASSGLEVQEGAKVYPNPITAASKLVYNALGAGKLNVRLVNMNGTSVYNQSYDIEAGENTIKLNLSERLPTGLYILIAEFNGKTEQVKLLKQ
jgi:hypothetical protein